MSTGVIKKVAGPLVIAEGMRDANMFDVVRVSNQRLIGEIIEMHGDEDAAEIQHGGQDRPECDLTIGHAHVLGHEERGRAVLDGVRLEQLRRVHQILKGGGIQVIVRQIPQDFPVA